MNFDNEMIKGISQSEFEKAFKKEYPHADYLACLKFDEVENQYKPINEEVEPPDVNFWVCVGVNTGWWAWQYRQTEVDEARAKAQMCRDEKTHAINRWSAVCKERDELQRRNQMLNDNIKEQGQKLVYQNEVIETQAEKLLGLRDEKAELQKRVDAAFRVLSQLNALDDEAHKRWKREACMFSQGESNAYEHAVRLLEQALKGGDE